MNRDEKRFKVVALGCRTNQYEGQAFQDQLLGIGYQQVKEGEDADLCIVNTCTVTESADSHSRYEIRQLHRQNPNAKIIVTGCYAERQPELLQSIEGVTHVIPNKDKEKLLEILFPEEEIPEFSIKNFDAHTRAFVKVQDGCNSYCTYCIIPYVRGRSRSRTTPEIVAEAERLIAQGFKEIVLTGINIGDFDGAGSGERLADLVRTVDRIPGLKRLRVSSIDPDEVDEDLTDAIMNGKNTCHSMHVVLQSGSNVILKRMNRKYTRQIFLKTVDKLRQWDPDFTFTTDVIVGFPGETAADHAETLDVMRETQFAKVHMFPYSDRPRTRAATYPNKVPVELMRERKQEIMQVAEQTGFELRKKYVGKKMQVLTETESSGYTDNFLQVFIPPQQANLLIDVTILENTPSGLIA